MAKTALGIEENIESLLTYVLGFITGIVFLLIEKNSKLVRFHAMQSTITFIALFVIGWVLMFVPVIGGMLGMLMSLLELIIWIVLMIKAYQGEKFKLPIVGDIADKQIK